MDTTILIKTFERPAAVKRLIESIRNFYPTIPIIVVDDSRYVKETNLKDGVLYVKMDFDSGISAGRNKGVGLTHSKYVFTCDDDNIFTKNTDLEKAEQLIESSGCDILGVKEEGNDYYGIFQNDGSTVRYLNGNRGFIGGPYGDVTLYDFVPNLFIANTESLKKFEWDESLKIGEHFAYFHKHMGKIKVGFTDALSLAHEHINNPNYDSYRQRANFFVEKYMRENGIHQRIDLAGNIIQL